MAQGQVPNQPGAQNMQEMVWDEELATKAQQWASQCTFEHDPSRYLGKCLQIVLQHKYLNNVNKLYYIIGRKPVFFVMI